jgi:GntR family transcriptional regulator, sialic acid-inducible nan operon repressor
VARKAVDIEVPEKSVAAEICAALTAEISRGDIAEGEPLPTERELSERYSTSRPTVREALLMLSHRGYAELGGSRRPRARRPSVETVLEAATEQLREVLGDRTAGAHLEQIRQFVECGAAGYAAREARQRQISALEEALDACERAAGDVEAFIDADIAFHRTLVQIVDNDIILALHDLFVTALVRGRAPVADRLAHDRMVTAEHRAIFDAIVARDVEGAMTMMERHLDRAFRARLKESTNQQ